jgi:hypothetical protein
MDLWVMDLDDNGKWDRDDIALMVKTISEIDREHPELAGWINTYLDKGFLASRMVHFDVGGKRNPKYQISFNPFPHCPGVCRYKSTDLAN